MTDEKGPGRTGRLPQATERGETMRKVGRPRKIETPEEFDAKVDTYLKVCQSTEAPITWTGMALALGFTSRQAIDEYAHYPGFSDSVKRAKTLVEQAYEQRLHGTTPTGAIFALKNMGWSDRQELELKGSLRNLNLELLPDDLLQRVADGEHVMLVLANALERGLPPDELLGLPAASEEEGGTKDDV